MNAPVRQIRDGRRSGGALQPQLDEIKTALTMVRAEQAHPSGIGFQSYAAFKAIHRHLFQDVYDWAVISAARRRRN